jgi:LemA protein
MMILIIAGVALIVIIALFFIGAYNGLVKLNIRTDEAWSDITVQLKRRADLIPNLINTVKGYAGHEKDLLVKLTEARTAVLSNSGSDVQAAAAADNQLTGALKSVFAVAENYPDLKANQNFLQLQDELVDTEDKIQAARRFYNGAVRDFNTKRSVFPTNVVAGMLGFNKDKQFFEVEDRKAIEEPVSVQF